MHLQHPQSPKSTFKLYYSKGPASPQHERFSLIFLSLWQKQEYTPTHPGSARTVCPVAHSCLHQKVAACQVDGFLTAQMRKRKIFQSGETSWASNQWLLPGWGTEGKEAPQCVSKLLNTFTYTNLKGPSVFISCPIWTNQQQTLTYISVIIRILKMTNHFGFEYLIFRNKHSVPHSVWQWK